MGVEGSGGVCGNTREILSPQYKSDLQLIIQAHFLKKKNIQNKTKKKKKCTTMYNSRGSC